MFPMLPCVTTWLYHMSPDASAICYLELLLIWLTACLYAHTILQCLQSPVYPDITPVLASCKYVFEQTWDITIMTSVRPSPPSSPPPPVAAPAPPIANYGTTSVRITAYATANTKCLDSSQGSSMVTTSACGLGGNNLRWFAVDAGAGSVYVKEAFSGHAR
jgi:hypothetical protein